jgi:hypothetical protein
VQRRQIEPFPRAALTQPELDRLEAIGYLQGKEGRGASSG